MKSGKKKVSTSSSSSSSLEKRVKTLEKTVRCLSEGLSNLDNSFMNNVHQPIWETETKVELKKPTKRELLDQQKSKKMLEWCLYFFVFILFVLLISTA